MNTSMVQIRKSLSDAFENYHSVVRSASFNYEDWKERVRRLAPIVDELSAQAKSRIGVCNTEIATNSRAQAAALEKRAVLYKSLDDEKSQIAKVQEEKIGNRAEYAATMKSINDDKHEIYELEKEKDNNRHQYNDNRIKNAVVSAVIPVAGPLIGSNMMKGSTELYNNKKNILDRRIQENNKSIKKLDDNLKEILKREDANGESIRRLEREIEATKVEISAATDTLNDLRKEMGVWQEILAVCDKAYVSLQHTSGKFEVVTNAFDELKGIEKTLISTTAPK